MDLRYRGRAITAEDIFFIRELIQAHPGDNRRALSKRLCEAWQWKQANGALRDMVCRGLMLMLDRAGEITLPPVSYVRNNPLAKRARPAPVVIDDSPVECRLIAVKHFSRSYCLSDGCSRIVDVRVSGYSVESQAEDKAIRGRNLSADLVAGTAGQSNCPLNTFWRKSVKSRGLGQSPILNIGHHPL